MSDEVPRPSTGLRLMVHQRLSMRGLAPWPPPAGMLTSLRDQHASEMKAWVAEFPADQAREALFATTLTTLTLWRSALDRGEDGDAQRELHEKMLGLLAASLG